MAKVTTKQRLAIAETFDAAKEAAIQAAVQAEVPEDNGKLLMRNRDGKTLMCNFELGRRAGAPDPLSVVVNEEKFWMRRGMKMIVPFYVVLHMKNNIERTYRPVKDPETGRTSPVGEDGTSEPFNYTLIDPHPDNNPDWL